MGNQDQTGQSNNGKSEEKPEKPIIDLFLPAKFPGLKSTSRSVYEAICKELYRDQLHKQKPELKEGTLVGEGSFKIRIRCPGRKIRIRCPGPHKEQKPKEDIEPSTDAIAGILFSDKFTDRFARSNDDAYPVLAMMGGQLPLEKNFFRWGFASSLMGGTISRIIDDERDDQDAFVLLICGPDANDGLSTAFKNAFIGYGEHSRGKTIRIDKTILYAGEKSVPSDRSNEKGDPIVVRELKKLNDEIGKALTGVSKKNVKVSVVFHGYWSNYQTVISTVDSGLANWAEKRDPPHLYVDANYFLNIKRDKDTLDLKCPLECITGKQIGAENHFSLFAQEVVKLCKDAVASITVQPNNTERSRHAFRRYLKSCKFYETSFGTIFFRDDGELFMPLYRYVREKSGGDNPVQWKEIGRFKERDVIDRSSPVGVADLLAKTISHVDAFEAEDFSSVENVEDSKAFKTLIQTCVNSIAKVCLVKPERIGFWDLSCGTPQTLLGHKGATGVLELVKLLHSYGSCARQIKKRRYVQPIQINVVRKDINDNDTLRCYCLMFQDKGGKTIPRVEDVLGPNNATLQDKVADLKGIAKPLHEAFGNLKIDAGLKGSSPWTVWLALSQSNTYLNEVLCQRGESCVKEILTSGPESKCVKLAEGSVVVVKQDIVRGNLGIFIKDRLKDLRRERFEYVYCVPVAANEEGLRGCLTFPSREKLPLLDLQILSNCVTRIFQSIDAVIHRQEMLRANTRIAIGSIMSRNGSHNIGSHVLAALSHNVGTLPDDRILYQYIQHRMDYIATATTEFPRWSQPTMLVSNIMKEFLRQAHLLDYISRSEGLHAYKFQGHAVAAEQKDTIQIHVRRVDMWTKDDAIVVPKIKHEFIVYPRYDKSDEIGDIKADAIDFSEDLAVAIPGGTIGRHAFFTILENVIRNAAKHEWASAVRKSSSDDNMPHHLEIYVDFCDNYEEGTVSCLVWQKIVDSKRKGKPVANKDLIKNLRKKFRDRFFDDRGHLKRENWGIAEMRISAGYLIGCDIADVGALFKRKDEASAGNDGKLSKSGSAREIIRPVLVTENDAQYLGYRFELAMPKTLLVVFDREKNVLDREKNVLPAINAKCLKYGIEFRCKEDALSATSNSYSYVLFESNPLESERLRFPLRLVAPQSERHVAGYCGNLRQELKDLLSQQASDCQFFGLLENVYASWLKHIQGAFCGKAANLHPMLVLDLGKGGGGVGAGKSLVSDYDLCRFMFEHSFNAAVRSFLSAYKGASKEFVTLLAVICAKRNREIASARQLVAYGLGKDGVSIQEIQGILMRKRAVLQQQLDMWFEAEIAAGVVSWNEKTSEIIGAYWRCQLDGGKDVHKIGSSLSSLYSKSDFNCAVESFLSYLEDPILCQTESFLRKYEERICTLPEGFSEKGDNDVPAWNWEKRMNGDVKSLKILFTCNDSTKKDAKSKGDYCYFRHADPPGKVKGYCEPLSGSQGCLNVLTSFKRDVLELSNRDKGNLDLRNRVIQLMARLVETAKLQVLIVDERVRKFMDDHPEVGKLIKGIGIEVWDDNMKKVRKMFSHEGYRSRKQDGKQDGNDKILVIHQGIIDKLLGKHEDKNEVSQWLDRVEKSYRHVVITTGRGIPANIPDSARVLPYSAIESAILQRYPEKMILIDTIMNLLPINREV